MTASIPRWLTFLVVFLASCGGGSGGGVTATVPPTVSIAAASHNVTWSTTNATACTASGGWSGAQATSGSYAAPTLTSAATYTLTCTGAGGTGSGSVTIAGTSPTPAPTVTLTASGHNLTWSSTNATSCTASGGWSGAKANSGTYVAPTLTTTTTYTLTCTGTGGTGSGSVTIAGTTPTPAPTVTLSSPSVTSLSWSTTNATACTASGGWSGAKATSGTYTVPTLTVTTTFTLSCTGPGGTGAGSVTITVGTGSGPTSDSASKPGPLTVATYTAGIPVPSGSIYASPMIYYPTNGTGLHPGVVFIPGHNDVYMETPETLTQWGTLLASYGFVVLFVNPSDLGAAPLTRATALVQAMNTLVGENTRSGSPLAGKLDTQRLAVMGHSYGASGALYAANQNTDPRVKAAVAFCPVPTNGLYTTDAVPSLLIAGTGDFFVTDIQGQYNSIPATTSKVVAVYSQTSDVLLNSMHLIAHTPLGTHVDDPSVARIGLSFLQVYLMGDLRYQQFLVLDGARMDSFSYHP